VCPEFGEVVCSALVMFEKDVASSEKRHRSVSVAVGEANTEAIRGQRDGTGPDEPAVSRGKGVVEVEHEQGLLAFQTHLSHLPCAPGRASGRDNDPVGKRCDRRVALHRSTPRPRIFGAELGY
jgi:hypothetical protein